MCITAVSKDLLGKSHCGVFCSVTPSRDREILISQLTRQFYVMNPADVGRNVAVENEFSSFQIPSAKGASGGAGVGGQGSLFCIFLCRFDGSLKILNVSIVC